MNRRFTRLFLTILVSGFFVIGVTNSKAFQNCDIPTNINTSNVSNFSATLNWDLDTLVHHYRVRYRPTALQIGVMTITFPKEIVIIS